jgi:hypothetical protein
MEEFGVHLLALVHLADEWGDLVGRELADGVAEEALVVGESGKGRGSRGCGGGDWHALVTSSEEV